MHADYQFPGFGSQVTTYPSRPQRFPSFGFEFLRIRAIEVVSSMHSVDGVLYDLALGDEDWGFAIWASAEGEDGVNDSCTSVAGDDGVETEC